MPEDKNRNVIPSKERGGFLNDLSLRIKLIMRLMGDPRVNPLVKILPIASVLYLVFPDLAPGPIDDAAILWLGSYLFVELCPPHVVEEHMASINNAATRAWGGPPSQDDEVIDAEFQEEK